MRYAIISDIHGNLPALEAVLADAEKNGIDSYIFAGDYTEYCPWSDEVITKIRSLDRAYVIAGNGDERVKYFYDKTDTLRGVDQMVPALYACEQLSPENAGYLFALGKSCYVPLPYHGSAYVTHWINNFLDKSRPWGNSSGFMAAMEARPFTHEELLEMIAAEFESESTRAALRRTLPDNCASVVIFGHNHLQWHGYCDGRLLIDPGACGVPLDFDARAPYTILEDGPEGLVVEEKRVWYDVEAVIARVKSSDFYQRGKIWCDDLMIPVLRASEERASIFFKIARQIARQKGESGDFFTNETWREAGERMNSGDAKRTNKQIAQ